MQQAAHGRAEKEPNIYFYDVKCGISSSFSETLRKNTQILKLLGEVGVIHSPVGVKSMTVV